MTATSVVIPIRGLNGGKSRLASHLAPDERSDLIGGMASRVIDAVVVSGVADSILIVSREADLLRILRVEGSGVVLVHQPPQAIGLNAAIDLGRQSALERAADRLLVLSADLPLLSSRVVADFAACQGATDVVLGTDRARTGTNALMLRGRDVMSQFAFRFGPDSRRLHQIEAGRIGARYAEVQTPEIALDLDTPGDWAMLTGEVRASLLDSTSASRRSPVGAMGIDAMALAERA